MAGAKAKYAELDSRIEQYFSYCDSVNEGSAKPIKPYTLSGLMCWLGITRKEFEKLLRSERYSKSALYARSKIEAFIEENALTGGLSANAAANSLKYNFGWGEKLSDTPCEEARSLIITLDGDAKVLAG